MTIIVEGLLFHWVTSFRSRPRMLIAVKFLGVSFAIYEQGVCCLSLPFFYLVYPLSSNIFQYTMLYQTRHNLWPTVSYDSSSKRPQLSIKTKYPAGLCVKDAETENRSYSIFSEDLLLITTIYYYYYYYLLSFIFVFTEIYIQQLVKSAEPSCSLPQLGKSFPYLFHNA